MVKLHRITNNQQLEPLSPDENQAWLDAGKPYKLDGTVLNGTVYLIVTDEEAKRWEDERKAAALIPPPPAPPSETELALQAANDKIDQLQSVVDALKAVVVKLPSKDDLTPLATKLDIADTNARLKKVEESNAKVK